MNSGRGSAATVALLSLVVFAAAWRFALFVPAELWVRDLWVRLYADRATTARVTLVRIEESDIQRFGHPIPDAVLGDAVEKLVVAGALAVGLDVYRDEPVGDADGALARVAQDSSVVVVVRSLPSAAQAAIAPPAWASSEATGFTDVVVDRDGAVRRGLLYLWEGEQAHVSLALQMARRALAADGVRIAPGPGDSVRLGSVVVPPLDGNAGGYVAGDAGGYQFALDHRAHPQAIPVLTLSNLLDGAFDASWVTGRPVLIGTIAPSVKDRFPAPFQVGSAAAHGMHGVEIHAHALDQLLRTGLDAQPPLRSLPELIEALALLICCALGATLGVRARGVAASTAYALLLVAMPVLVAGAAWGARWWIPAALPAMGGLAALGLGVAVAMQRARREQGQILQLFGRFLSPSVARRIWEQRDAFLEGGRPRPQRVSVTVLMADLEGFSTAVQSLSPEDLLEWIDSWMSRMAEVVEGQGGIVDDYAGDGLKADFGVPLARTTEAEIDADAVAAVRCAWRMGEAQEALHDHWRARGLPTPRLRIGIASGPVVVGSLGGPQRLKYTCLGDTVNVAARLEALRNDTEDWFPPNRAFRILLTGETADRIEGHVRTEEVGETVLKGRREATVVHRVVAPGSHEASAQGGAESHA